MKKNRIILFLIFLLSLFSCKKKEPNALCIKDDIVFSNVLETEILKLIEMKKENTEYDDLICNIIISEDRFHGNRCILSLSLNNRIVQMLKFSSPCDSLEFEDGTIVHNIGYTFLEQELIICHILSGTCNNGLIKENKLKILTDSIMITQNKNEHQREFMPSKTFEIINADSLILIEEIKPLLGP